MDVFSGKRNPTWDLTESQSDELLGRVLDGGVEVLPVDAEIPILGYRGFKVEAVGRERQQLAQAGAPTAFTVSSVRQNATSFAADTETMLLGDGSPLFSGSVTQHSLDRITSIADEQTALDLPETPSWRRVDGAEESDDTGVDMGDDTGEARLSSLASCLLKGGPNSDFSFWNAEDRHRMGNNCYNYGCNWRTNTFAQPGRGGNGKPFWEGGTLSAANCKKGCLADGLKASNPCNGTSHYKLAIVVWPGADYHFYRRVFGDRKGHRWAHKAGKSKARNTDNSGKWIRSPKDCDRGGYTEWGGYVYRTRGTGDPNIE